MHRLSGSFRLRRQNVQGQRSTASSGISQSIRTWQVGKKHRALKKKGPRGSKMVFVYVSQEAVVWALQCA